MLENNKKSYHWSEKLQRYRVSKQLAKTDRGVDKFEGEIRRTEADDESESEEEGATCEDKRARRLNKEDKNTKVEEKTNRLDTLERNMKKMDEKLDNKTEGLAGMMKKLQEQLDRMEKRLPRNRSTSRSRVAQEDLECYYCHEKGHIKPNCPKRMKDLNEQESNGNSA